MKRFLIKVLLYSLGIYLVNLVLGWGLKSLGPKYSEAAYGQVKWENFRSLSPQSLDIFFLGSSHFLSGIDPAIVDSVSGKNSYNMARVGLNAASAYVLLNEVLTTQSPKVVVLDIFYRTFTATGSGHLYDFGYSTLDGNKVAFARENFNFYEQTRLFFPTYVYKTHFPALRPLLGLKAKKDNWEELHFKGYIRHNSTISEAALVQNEFINYTFRPEEITEENLEYLDKIVQLCKERDIQLVWVTTPLPDACLKSMVNRQAIDDYFEGLANRYRIPYINYNNEGLRQKIAFDDRLDYSDDDHVNYLGAEKMSKDLAMRFRDQNVLTAQNLPFH